MTKAPRKAMVGKGKAKSQAPARGKSTKAPVKPVQGASKRGKKTAKAAPAPAPAEVKRRSRGRPPEDEKAPGMYQRHNVWWVRYTVGKKQFRVSTGETVFGKAWLIAESLRGRVVDGVLPHAWDKAVEDYIAKKRREKKFTEASCNNVRYALAAFKRLYAPESVTAITTARLAEFYETLLKEGAKEATAQSYTTKVSSFGTFLKLPVKAPEYPVEPGSRQKVLRVEQIIKLINECDDSRTKFLLFCGFTAGFRKAEMAMATPEWFNIQGQEIIVPELDNNWRPKSKRGRRIPMTDDFRAFLEVEYTEWVGKPFMIAWDAEGGKRYRWDPRYPVLKYFKEKGLGKGYTLHMMRHSYTTALAEGNLSGPLVSAYTGDRIKTVEKHYLHVSGGAAVVTDIFRGVTREQKFLDEFRTWAALSSGTAQLYANYDAGYYRIVPKKTPEQIEQEKRDAAQKAKKDKEEKEQLAKLGIKNTWMRKRAMEDGV